MVRTATFASPLGEIAAAFSDKGLCGLVFSRHRAVPAADILARYAREPLEPGEHPLSPELQRQLEQYFARERRQFDIPLDMRGSPYQLRAWRELASIPYGETITYAELARRAGATARAAGSACGANPVSIVVPCHRVVGSDGSLRGYGGGLDAKRFLLELEGAIQPRLI